MLSLRRVASIRSTAARAMSSATLVRTATANVSRSGMLTAGGLSSASVAIMTAAPQQQLRFCASSNHSGMSALDVATQVNKLKKMHQTGQGSKKELEATAWRELNTLNEEQINNAEGKAVALLLNAWAYFAKFWEKGKEGPGDQSQ